MTGISKRLPLWIFLLAFGILGSMGGACSAYFLPPQWAIIFSLSAGIVWANSSFDPQQNSRLHQIWQYVIPLILGFAGLACMPMGIFFGKLTGEGVLAVAISMGFGVAVGTTCFASLILMNRFLGLTIAQTQYFLNTFDGSETDIFQREQRQQMIAARQLAADNTFWNVQTALAWSSFQGMSVSGLLAFAVLEHSFLGLGLVAAWHGLLTLLLIQFHTSLQNKVRRLARFVIIFSSLVTGSLAGAFL